MELAPASLAGLLCLAVLGATIQSAVAFGQSLVLAPALFALLPASQAITVSLLLAVVVNLLVLYAERRPIRSDRRAVWTLLAAAVPASVIGALAGGVVEKGVIQLAVGAVVLTGVWLRLGQVPTPRHGGGRSLALGGLAAGFLNTTTSLSGPPLVLALTGRRYEGGTLRDTLAESLLALNVIAIAAVVALTPLQEVVHGAIVASALLPAILIGHRAGQQTFVRLTTGGHMSLVLVVLTCAGVASVAAGLSSLA